MKSMFRNLVSEEDKEEFWRLYSEEDKTPTEIAEITGWARPTVSRHLEIKLKAAMELQDTYCNPKEEN